MKIRLAELVDVAAMLEISNWAAINTPANFSIEPESLASWEQSFRETHEMYPWVVGDAEMGEVNGHSGDETLPLTPSLGGRGKILGFAKASPWKGRCAYDWSVEATVYVHPDHFGKGIGKSLYGKLFPILKAQGYRTLLGGITLLNEASVRLHESFGMKRVAMFESIGWKFEQWHDVGYWQLILCDDFAPPQRIRPVSEVIDH